MNPVSAKDAIRNLDLMIGGVPKPHRRDDPHYIIVVRKSQSEKEPRPAVQKQKEEPK